MITIFFFSIYVKLNFLQWWYRECKNSVLKIFSQIKRFVLSIFLKNYNKFVPVIDDLKHKTKKK